ncbi:MAG TPA: carboxymuconolactone decarboxylase family protein [Gammaproteobacteria bacterium]|nr:carboxymuconolactone decarboxylase family protein [Gammaproteobacteria bacterium]
MCSGGGRCSADRSASVFCSASVSLGFRFARSTSAALVDEKSPTGLTSRYSISSGRTAISTSRDRARSISALLAAVGLSLAGGSAVAQQSSADLDPVSGARLPYLTREDLGEAGKRLADVFARGGKPTDPVKGPLAFAAYNVPVAVALLDLHDGAVAKGTLDAHVRELAILVACREMNYTFEWNAHEPQAVKAGVDPKVIDAVRGGLKLAGVPEKDAAVIRFGRELLGDRRMSSATFAKAVELFGAHGAMDLVAVMSTYAVSGFYAIAVDEHPPGRPALEPLPR